mmetsp:Transcript_88081/g.265067  ORF Transcript_88081/g.265067 Transcript_88081/m.265067 type:complete len:213 (-) Transcript_88081:910-1548(-)
MLNVAGSAREHILNVQLCAVALQHGLNRHWRALLWCHPHAFCRSELVHCRGGSGRQARDIKTEHMLDPALLYPYTAKQHPLDDCGRRHGMRRGHQENLWHIPSDPQTQCSDEGLHDKNRKGEEDEEHVDAVGSIAKPKRSARLCGGFTNLDQEHASVGEDEGQLDAGHKCAIFGSPQWLEREVQSEERGAHGQRHNHARLLKLLFDQKNPSS